MGNFGDGFKGAVGGFLISKNGGDAFEKGDCVDVITSEVWSSQVYANAQAAFSVLNFAALRKVGFGGASGRFLLLSPAKPV